jgi:hypothetical protein
MRIKFIRTLLISTFLWQGFGGSIAEAQSSSSSCQSALNHDNCQCQLMDSKLIMMCATDSNTLSWEQCGLCPSGDTINYWY